MPESASPPVTSIVLPVRDEAEGIGPLVHEIRERMCLAGLSTEILLVDDHSTDGTADRLLDLHRHCPEQIRCLTTPDPGGQPLAILTGLAQIRGRAVVVMDADGQDPPRLLPECFRLILEENHDLVEAVRCRRKDPFAKRMCAWTAYRVLYGLSRRALPMDTGEFCAMSDALAHALVLCADSRSYLRGLRRCLSDRPTSLLFMREARRFDRSSIRLRDSLQLAGNGFRLALDLRQRSRL
ncbi:MAG: glycosyltransferase [Kiritimatiellia bacterium]